MEGIHTWNIEEMYEKKPGKVFRALYTKDDGAMMRVDIKGDVGAPVATEYMRGRLAAIEAVYANTRSPYPGFISDEIACDQSFLPTRATLKTENAMIIKTMRVYLTDRLTLGACTKESVAYQSLMAIFYCPSRSNLYEVEFIQAPEHFSSEKLHNIVKSIRCE
jgi:hypothetical protein